MRFAADEDLYKIAEIDYSASTEFIRDYKPVYEKETDSNSKNSNIRRKEAISILNNTYLRRIYDLYGMKGLENPKEFEGYVSRPLTLHKSIPIIDFYEGRLFNFSIIRRRICKCPQDGYMCSLCKGLPTIDETIHLQVNLKKGSADPFVYTFYNLTDATPNSSPGNLKISLRSISTGFYHRFINDIHVLSLNSFRNLEVGKSISYYWIDNDIRFYKVQEISNKYVLPGQGMPIEGTNDFGDLIIHIQE